MSDTGALRLVQRPELHRLLVERGYEGVIVIEDPLSSTLFVSDFEHLDTGFIPASTFKIPNSLIALETQVATPDFVLPWDGVERWSPAWNRDHDLRSAFEHSVVWYYQEIARRIGPTRMTKWLGAAEYGNAQAEGAIDGFWLNGGIRISPREQTAFIRRVHEGQSPFSQAVVRTFLDEIMVRERRPNHTIRAKTGWAKSADFACEGDAGFDGNLGWFVGSVESAEGDTVYFATLVMVPEPAPKGFSEDRVKLGYAALESMGYLGPSTDD